MESRPDDKLAAARRFKVLRRKSLMSQSSLARAIGICRQSVNKIENRRAMPNYITWEKFCALELRHERALKVSRAIAGFRPPK